MHNNPDHIRRINEVILYIENNISDNLRIEDLAEIAFFSKYHFNRIFKSVTGESVYHYIKRIRLERSAFYLWSSDKTISEIATMCGFNTTSNFSYSFKKHFGHSAIEQRKLNKSYKANIGDIVLNVELKDLPEMTLAYIKCIGSYDEHIVPTARELYKWCRARDIKTDSFDFICMGYDSPYVTKEEYFRSDICTDVPAETVSSGKINIMKFPKSRVVSIKFKFCTSVSKYRDDLDSWILQSGFQTIIGVPTLIIYRNTLDKDLYDINPDNIEIEMCVPVMPK